MSKNVRLQMTNDEKMVNKILGDSSDHVNFAMGQDLNEMIAKEKATKFNSECDKHAEKLKQQTKEIEECQKNIEEKISTIEIKPLFNRLLIKPFASNPFQRMVIENGVIVDTGGLNPDIQFNTDRGEWEERDQNIIVGTVVETGPDCKYIQPGDTVFYLKQLPTPVPFFKLGFWTLKEENVIAVVNEGLTERFSHVE